MVFSGGFFLAALHSLNCLISQVVGGLVGVLGFMGCFHTSWGILLFHRVLQCLTGFSDVS